MILFNIALFLFVVATLCFLQTNRSEAMRGSSSSSSLRNSEEAVSFVEYGFPDTGSTTGGENPYDSRQLAGVEAVSEQEGQENERELYVRPLVTVPTQAPTMKVSAKLPGKKGACFTLRDEGEPGSWVENLPKVVALSPYWNYSWGSKRIAQQPANIEFVPMIWGAYGKEGFIDRINTDIMPQVKAGLAKRVLMYNEPDSPIQANIAVEKAIEFWPLAQGIGLPLGSPACVQARGIWMTNFVNEINSDGLRMKYIAIHWYGGASASIFKSEITAIYNYYGKKWPIWITEFATADWDAATPAANKFSRQQVLTFMQSVIPWLQKTSWIFGYSWFPFKPDSAPGTCSSLFEANGSLTALGRYYKSVTNSKPSGDLTIRV
jgi:hypothetical protein